MKSFNWLYLVALVALVVIVVHDVLLWLKRRKDFAVLRERVHEHTDRYAFLVDKKLRVKETNFYALNEQMPDDQPYRLGNVLHCQSGCESGLCGTGLACKTCPIRLVIRNAFQLKRNFDHVSATMHLYDENRQVNTVDVQVDGEIVTMGNETLMLVNVRKTGEKQQ